MRVWSVPADHAYCSYRKDAKFVQKADWNRLFGSQSDALIFNQSVYSSLISLTNDRASLKRWLSKTNLFKSRSNHSLFTSRKIQTWLVQSRPLVNPPEERLQGSSLPPKLLARVPQQQEAWRSHTDTGQEQLHWEKSVVTRRAPNCWSENCPSSDWFVKSPRTSRLICDSRAQLLWLFRKLARPTWLVFSKIPTCVPFTPSVSPSCQRTSSLPAESVVNVLRLLALAFTDITALFRATKKSRENCAINCRHHLLTHTHADQAITRTVRLIHCLFTYFDSY